MVFSAASGSFLRMAAAISQCWVKMMLRSPIMVHPHFACCGLFFTDNEYTVTYQFL